MKFVKQVILAASLVGVFGAATATETKKVCIDVKDKAGNVVKDKAGKPKQNCKNMKVHKKLEGTKVPEKK